MLHGTCKIRDLTLGCLQTLSTLVSETLDLEFLDLIVLATMTQ